MLGHKQTKPLSLLGVKSHTPVTALGIKTYGDINRTIARQFSNNGDNSNGIHNEGHSAEMERQPITQNVSHPSKSGGNSLERKHRR